jgi:hypothetical protein
MHFWPIFYLDVQYSSAVSLAPVRQQKGWGGGLCLMRNSQSYAVEDENKAQEGGGGGHTDRLYTVLLSHMNRSDEHANVRVCAALCSE